MAERVAAAAAPPGDRNGRDRLVINTGFASLILSGVRQAGLDGDRILARAGIDRDLLERPDGRLSQRQFAALIRLLTRITRDEFWMLCSRPIKPGSFRTMCDLLVRCRDLREAVQAGCRFYRLLIDDFTIRCGVADGEACIWMTDRIADPERRRMLNGAVLFFVYGLICWLVGRNLPLAAVGYAFGPRPFGAELEPAYGTRIAYHSPRTELRFAAALLDLPVLPDAQHLRRFLASMPHALLLRYRDDTGIAERVRAALRRDLAGNPGLAEVAAQLGLQPQALRHRLRTDAGLGFQDLKDQVRSDAALHLLQGSRLSLEDLAVALGFSEISAFHRAFRRWTGRTPGEVRQAGRAA